MMMTNYYKDNAIIVIIEEYIRMQAQYVFFEKCIRLSIKNT